MTTAPASPADTGPSPQHPGVLQLGVNTFGPFGMPPRFSAEQLEVLSLFSHVELSAVEPVEAAPRAAHIRQLAASHTLSFHGPMFPEVTLEVLDDVSALVSPESPIVGHSDIVTAHPEAWSKLGGALLVENLGANKDPDLSSLQAAFAAAPQARLCLDVSHAANTCPDPEGRIVRLLEIAGQRVGEIHVGCLRDLPGADPAAPPEVLYAFADPVLAVQVPLAVRLAIEFGVPLVIEGRYPWTQTARIATAALAEAAGKTAA